MFKSIFFIKGIIATLGLLFFYFIIVSAISGTEFFITQFFSFWYYILSLAFGFGIQTGLYFYLKDIIHLGRGAGKILAVSGTTSTISMVSCCAHYLVNILPIIGVSGIIGLVAQYQIQFFRLGLLFNLIGIIYIARKIWEFKIKFY